MESQVRGGKKEGMERVLRKKNELLKQGGGSGWQKEGRRARKR